MYSPIKGANQDSQKDLERLELVLDAAKLGIWDWYIQSGEVVFNKEWKRMLGYEMDELKDEIETWSTLIHPDDKDHTYATLNEHIKDRVTDHYESEHRLKHKDGTYRWILDTGRIVESKPNPDPAIANSIAIRATGIHQDITRRKNLELHLKEEKEKLAKANQVKATFIANMSHEIRTPISGIMGALQLLQQEAKYKNNHLVQIVQDSTEHLLSIVNDILDFSKMEEGNLLIQNEIVYLPDLLEIAKSIYHSMIVAKGLKFDLKIVPEEERELYFSADSKRLLQIIFNLLNNSLKFTETGKIILEIRIQSEDKAPTIQIIVKDTGRGMSEEFLKKIFEPFLQEHDSKSRDQGGTGLGTTIVKSLVNQMHGTIEVESKLKYGTTFKISLPLHIISTAEGQQEMRERRKSSIINIQDRDYQQKKILLVEDNELNAQIAKMILKQLNLAVTHAKNGQEVLDYVHKHHSSNHPCALILMDSQLPIYDGETLTRMLREEGYEMPIIALTANVYADDIQCYLKAGMDDFLGKPYKIEDLIQKLDKYLLFGKK